MRSKFIATLLAITCTAQLLVPTQVYATGISAEDKEVEQYAGDDAYADDVENSDADSNKHEETSKEASKEETSKEAKSESALNESSKVESSKVESTSDIEDSSDSKDLNKKETSTEDKSEDEEETTEEETEEETTEEETEEETTEEETVEVRKNLKLHDDTSDLDLGDDDGDGLVNYWEAVIGTDPTNADTDGDGLSDYEEVSLIGTDPLEFDTDGNGVCDANEDADKDGVKNLVEMRKGTDPHRADTDGDGLSDYDEIYVYHTNPNKFDSDKDGVSDGFEVKMDKEGYDGFNPRSAASLFTFDTTSEDGICTLTVTAKGADVESVSINKVDDNTYEINAASEFKDATLAVNTYDLKVDNAKVYQCDNENKTEKVQAIESNLRTAREIIVPVEEAGVFQINDSKEVAKQDKENKKLIKKSGIDVVADKDGVVDMCPKGEKDSNKDGICDKYTKLMCEGVILTGDGASVFGDKTYNDIQSSSDFDKDTIPNGAEVSLKVDENDVVYAVLSSSPVCKDTDEDGINDATDTAPFSRGLEGGVVGSLQIVGSHNEEDIFTAGHSFLVYTSYVDGSQIKIKDLYGSYDFNKKYAGQIEEEGVVKEIWESALSWRDNRSTTWENKADAIRKADADDMWPIQPKGRDTFNLDRGEYLTIGNFTMLSMEESLKDALLNGDAGTMIQFETVKAAYEALTGEEVDILFVMSHIDSIVKKLSSESYIKNNDVINGKTDGGIWINREMYDQKYLYDQYPHKIYRADVTQAELDRLLSSLEDNNYYSSMSHNCTSVAVEAWNEALGYVMNEDGTYELTSGGDRKKSELFMASRGQGVFSVLDFPGALCEYIDTLPNVTKDGKGNNFSNNSKIVKGELVRDKVYNGPTFGDDVDDVEQEIPEDSKNPAEESSNENEAKPSNGNEAKPSNGNEAKPSNGNESTPSTGNNNSNPSNGQNSNSGVKDDIDYKTANDSVLSDTTQSILDNKVIKETISIIENAVEVPKSSDANNINDVNSIDDALTPKDAYVAMGKKDTKIPDDSKNGIGISDSEIKEDAVSEMINDIASVDAIPENMGFFARLLAFIKKLIKSFVSLFA